MMNKKSLMRSTWLAVALVAAPALAGAQSYSRTEVITYHDNTNKWVLGQVASRAINGTVVESTTFSATTAQPLTYSSYGKLQQTLGCNSDAAVWADRSGPSKR